MTTVETGEYEAIGKAVVENLRKLMAGEYKGRAVIIPIRTPGEQNIGAMTRVQVDLPTITTSRINFKDGNPYSEFLHYTWIPDSQAYVLDDYVLREKNKAKQLNEPNG